ncbi:MAG: 16S rRNA (adenine(1518)-N(6)/adenine(1519)-N(6))-dimethyltransferase RsmA [Actinomycetota bacterium]
MGIHLTRTRVRQLLEDGDLAPSRALGQNFLCDGHMIEKIVRLSGVGPGDRVIEIGPGLGSLTVGLCAAGARVTAIEVDRYLVPALRTVVGDYERSGSLRIVNQDVREVDWDELLGDEEWTVVANLPYNIATPLVLDLLAAEPRLVSWLVMVQREAGERLVADPGSKVYGIPSVLVAYWASAQLVGSVGADLFHPKPNVESVLVRIDRSLETPAAPFDRVAELVRAGFGQRRKMLRRSLADLVTPDQMGAASIDPTARPEELGVEAWVRLATVSP